MYVHFVGLNFFCLFLFLLQFTWLSIYYIFSRSYITWSLLIIAITTRESSNGGLPNTLKYTINIWWAGVAMVLTKRKWLKILIIFYTGHKGQLISLARRPQYMHFEIRIISFHTGFAGQGYYRTHRSEDKTRKLGNLVVTGPSEIPIFGECPIS